MPKRFGEITLHRPGRRGRLADRHGTPYDRHTVRVAFPILVAAAVITLVACGGSDDTGPPNQLH
jgi:hypothetical protein